MTEGFFWTILLRKDNLMVIYL